MRENMKDIHLLYVDDEVEWLDTVRQTLQGKGFLVETVSEVEEALKRVGEQNFDMVLLDVRLKDANGWELVREFKRKNKWMAVVLYTSEYDFEKLADIYGVEAEDYLEKGNDIALLINRLKALYCRFIKQQEQSEVFEIAPGINFVSGCGVLNVRGDERCLKSNEAKLLFLLCQKMNLLVTKQELCEGIWGKNLAASKDKALRNLVVALRTYFTDTNIEIHNRRWAGYILYVKNR